MEIFRTHRAALAVLIASLCLIYFLGLGGWGLIEPDEGRYSEIPREMLASGDWVTPRLNGVKYFEKPVMYYWMAASSFKLFGESEFTARIPCAASALTGALATYAMGAPYGPSAAFLGAFITGTGFLWFALSQITLTDMALGAFMTLSILCIFKGLTGSRPLLWLGYAFMGLSVLTKGLIGIVLPGGIFLIWILLTRRTWLLLKGISPVGILAFLGVTAPWFYKVIKANPDFAWFFFVHEHFLRYSTMVSNRYQPWWFFLALLPVALLPWTGTVLQGVLASLGELRYLRKDTALRDSCQDPASESEEALLLLIWSFFILAFFSASKSKLIPYMVPAMPPLGLMGGIYMARCIEDRQYRSLLPGFAVTALIMITLGAALILYPNHQDRFDPATLKAVALIAGGMTIAAGLIPLLAAWARKNPWIVSAVCAAAFLLGMKQIFPVVAQARSPKALALMVQKELTDDSKVIIYKDYDQAVPFYLKRLVVIVQDGGDYGELSFGYNAEKPSWFISTQDLKALWESSRAIMIVRPEHLKEIEQLGIKYRTAGQDPAYYGKMILVNR
ncbi:PMT family glycosyltransferase, 4-amino-4-deoxy-L-arabinose transferase [Thermanaerovibrio velox DSM 12556]|uniref:PMT family glycosyltransferase, 4-amino-4-deoxy-L-arabinose transferase n=1 Tax=Thermanaerovibrio velox DSM 12556 TaxID=926567 RepID=H0UPR6_9BACT|nr:glycosyltransferase family 39 protein [Thermanaerovibrio velox]EHM10625.1 PMT family glycosyltransferase, 4-amino-4-deoxy-L-arabinose transferase [Thermanaerovibrio velox DSM 12556]